MAQFVPAKTAVETANGIIKERYSYACGLNGEWKDGTDYSQNFFLSPDGQCLDLYIILKNLGYKLQKYQTPYLWSVARNFVEIRYVEGDVHIHPLPDP